MQSGNSVYEITFSTTAARFDSLVTTFDQAARSFRTELMPFPGTSPTTSQTGCAKDANVSVVDGPIGAVTHDGDALSVTVRYDLPGCDRVSGVIYGTHASGSPEYTYWCTLHNEQSACVNDHLASSFALGPEPIKHNGTSTLKAVPGTYPPLDLSSPPTFEGFTACFVRLTFSGSATPGTSYEYDVGTPCTTGATAGALGASNRFCSEYGDAGGGAAAHCGDGLTATFVGTAPLGRIFHDGDQLPAAVSYSAPGCDSVRAYFDGFFSRSTPWCQYWVTQPSSQAAAICTSGGIPESLPGDFFSLSQPAGTLRFVAQPGPVPPVDQSAPPNLEGMRYCGVLLRFDSSDRFPQDVFLGNQCYFGVRLP